ncbi:phage lytic cycle repressor MrpR family protein [Siminovitchia fordii]|uniref:Integrase n=1 Tax=Siminovitchia fordii TaxID=254759 RepID=A0ABQ4KC25_9BACI|nr:hypothetical protein [Siminovitchia fordii]GIN22577.1 hypothetical protein J1TS3_37110 [Siminovitchia fordii]
MNKMYNEDIKKRFLHDYYKNETTRKVVEYIFYYSYGNEAPLGKDLYDFSLDEVGATIANSRPKSLNVAATRGNFISQYISWAIENNLRTSNIHPMQSLSREWYKQFIDKDIKQFISKRELDYVDDNLVNIQDRIVLRLLFEGVYGTECSELRNLRWSDVEEEAGKVKLYDDVKGERFIYLGKDVIELIRKAYYSNEDYHNKNGTVEERSLTSQIVDSEYVVRNLKRGRVREGERVSQITILNRIKMIAELFNLPDITPKSLSRSGMIYMAYEILKNKPDGALKELEYEDFEKIAIKYNLTPNTINNHTYYNSAYMKQFINERNIKKLYEN